jgi:hypothetical protein
LRSKTPSGTTTRRALLLKQRLQTVLGASKVEHLYVYLRRAYAFLNAREKAQDACEELVAYAMRPLHFLAEILLKCRSFFKGKRT